VPFLFPTEQVTAAPEETQTAPVKFGKSWVFDFDQGDFVLSPTGKVVEADGAEAYRQWAHKILLTPRYRHVVYSRNYGQEFEDLLRRNLTRAGNESEIKRMVTEALMVDQRTASVGDFTFDWQEDAVYFTCTVTTAQGEQVQISGQVQGVS
jgi:phage baseplate assembly protein W